MSELYYIQQTAGDVERPSLDDLRAFSEKYDFPLGAHDEVFGLAMLHGNHLFEQKDIEGARYFWTIAYSLTKSDSVKKLLDDLPPKMPVRAE